MTKAKDIKDTDLVICNDWRNCSRDDCSHKQVHIFDKNSWCGTGMYCSFSSNTGGVHCVKAF